MSITPYNNYTVFDLSGVRQPYVNSTIELGYFSGGNLGTIPNNTWRSVPVVLNTNNGIARVDASGGLNILNAGIYKINLSVFPTSTQDGSSNILFNFGTTYLYDVSLNNIVNAFGGVCPTGMFTYDISNNPSFPGIISWIANSYSSGNATDSNFVQNPTTYELGYNYNNAGYSNRTLYSGICTTEITFILYSSATIFFNVSTNSTTGVTMGNCSFTLELFSTYSFPLPTWRWSQLTNAPTSASWFSITSSSNGQYLAAVVNGGSIYTSSDSGANWIPRNATPLPATANWFSITSSSNGQYLAAVVNGGTIYTSSNSGANWIALGISNSLPSFSNWYFITSSSNGQYLAAGGGGTYIWISSNSGASWNKLTAVNAPVSISSITLSNNGQYLAACADGGYIYTSSNSGTSWTIRYTDGSQSTRFWVSITSSIDGKYLAACANGSNIWTSSNYGVNWSNNNNSPAGRWISMASSSDGSKLAAVAYPNTSYIYTSSNYGVNWIKINGLSTNANWYCIASSSDGTKLVAVTNNNAFGTSTGIWRGVYS